ncbi:dihydrofolate reductase [Cellulomonas endophytica]|uniref:dihydrofolate reductase n=1 Tax=Cellulomonas endophytica TaxID=2494735 RepID=UPI001F0CB89E|nr:dihydrofolate reductase [Cellulomonas endophytica]
MGLKLIWAQTPDGVIGLDNDLPWRIPEDLARFRRLTSGHPVVMGRRTWESLPEIYRPLPGRDNVVLTHDRGYDAPGAVVATSLDDALAVVGDRDAWVIGGGTLYADALTHADTVEVTIVDRATVGDTFAPVLDERRWVQTAHEPAEGWYSSVTEGTRYRFITYGHRPQSQPAVDPRLQAPHAVRCDWGRAGARAVAAGSDRIAVVVDVLTFTTTVAAACAAGIEVAPFRWHDPRAAGYAERESAVLAGSRSTGGPSLSPGSVRASGLSRLVLPSPNGATTALTIAATGAEVVAGSIRNADAVARWCAARLATDPHLVVGVVPAGEGWPDGAFRPSVEDLWGAGAVIEALRRHGVTDRSVEAEAARQAWLAVADDPVGALRESASGRELSERGWADDVVAAADLDADGVAPVLVDGWFRGRTPEAAGAAGPGGGTVA